MDVEKLLDGLGSNFSPVALRELASTLLRLADSIDQNWDPETVRSAFPAFSKAARIERNAVPLSISAVREEKRARIRDEAIGAEIVGVPAWNMLLELFKQFSGAAMVSTKSLQLIAGCPETTALRIIDRLVERGLVVRSQSSSDRRVTFVSLTREGVVKVGSVLERVGG